MANPFLNTMPRDVETAIMLENANITDIGKAVAYTDGSRVFINTDDNLYRILPAYNNGMLKWLLWHERMHMELKHHNRFFKYLKELDDLGLADKFQVTKEEVNIIMDILVHDWMSTKFPELVDIAVNNLAQFRNRNSLGYTFKSFALEEMLEEYRAFKKGDTPEDKTSERECEDSESKGKEGKSKDTMPGDSKDTPEEKSEEHKGSEASKMKAHAEGGSPKKSDGSIEHKDETPEIEDAPMPEPEHDKTDWSKLKDIDTKEFIEEGEADAYMHKIEELKRKKIRIARLTETLNGLATSTRRRSYAMPSTTYCGGSVMLKGSTPGKAMLHLCFDASGSMGSELALFKSIISKSIPQAMECPCTWFSGYGAKIMTDPTGRSFDYYKGKFKDIVPVSADSGYSDDGDRTIELCFKAEQAGYAPIGVTDGGGRISWSKDMIKQLKRTVLVCPRYNKEWLEAVRKINPQIQTIEI